jgi:hypothetical protein
LAVLEHFNEVCIEIEHLSNVEMLRRRAPPPTPQAQAKLVSP